MFEPAQAIVYIDEIRKAVPLETFSFLLTPPGVPVSSMFEHLELFTSKVMPHFN